MTASRAFMMEVPVVQGNFDVICIYLWPSLSEFVTLEDLEWDL